MPSRRRDFLFNLGGALFGSGLIIDKLSASSILSNSNKSIKTPELRGTKLGNISPIDEPQHQVREVNGVYNIRYEWDVINNAPLFTVFEIEPSELRSLPRNVVRDPMRVFDKTLERDFVGKVAGNIEELVLTEKWKSVSIQALQQKMAREVDADEYECVREKDYLLCREEIDQKQKDEMLENGEKKTESLVPGWSHVTQIEHESASGESKSLDLVPEIVNFAQSIEYELDYKRGTFDYAQYPSETIYLGVGDCEDTAILLAGLLENLTQVDIRTALAFPPGHCAALAAIPDLPQSDKYEEYVRINDVPYTFFETTKSVDIYGTPDAFENHTPTFVYQQGNIVKFKPSVFPSAARRSLQFIKETVIDSFK